MTALRSLLEAGLENAFGNGKNQFNSAVRLDRESCNDGFNGADNEAANKHEFSRSHDNKRVCFQFSA